MYVSPWPTWHQVSSVKDTEIQQRNKKQRFSSHLSSLFYARSFPPSSLHSLDSFRTVVNAAEFRALLPPFPLLFHFSSVISQHRVREKERFVHCCDLRISVFASFDFPGNSSFCFCIFQKDCSVRSNVSKRFVEFTRQTLIAALCLSVYVCVYVSVCTCVKTYVCVCVYSFQLCAEKTASGGNDSEMFAAPFPHSPHLPVAFSRLRSRAVVGSSS